MEYCSGGDLSIFIRKKQALPEKIVRRFLQQLGKIKSEGCGDGRFRGIHVPSDGVL